jgi:transposase
MPVGHQRKNALFAGSDSLAKRWAYLASLIETAKLNGIDPLTYLGDILARLVRSHPINRSSELLPWRSARQPC